MIISITSENTLEIKYSLIIAIITILTNYSDTLQINVFYTWKKALISHLIIKQWILPY